MELYIDVENNEELNQKVQEFAMQGYSIESNVSGIVVMKRKTYNTGILIILILFFIIGGILYYLLSKPDVVTIKVNNKSQASLPQVKADSYCPECGGPLTKDDLFCSSCGKPVKKELPEGKKETPEKENE